MVTVYYLDLTAAPEDTVSIMGNQAAFREFESLEAARQFMAAEKKRGGLVFSYRSAD